MKKKVLKIAIALTVAFGAIIAVKKLTAPQTVEGSKSVELVFIDLDQNTIYDQTVKTDAELLGELINEVNNTDGLQIDIESGLYGSMIMGVNGIVSDSNNGPWWMIYSETNKDAIAQGYCNGIDTQTIYDGDIFKFILEKNW